MLSIGIKIHDLELL